MTPLGQWSVNPAHHVTDKKKRNNSNAIILDKIAHTYNVTEATLNGYVSARCRAVLLQWDCL